MTPTLSPLTISFLTAIRELYAMGPDGDGRGFEAKLSHAEDWIAGHSVSEFRRLVANRGLFWCSQDTLWRAVRGELNQLLESHTGCDPYLYDLIPGAAAERERALRGE